MKIQNPFAKLSARQKILICLACGVVGFFLIERFFFASLRAKIRSLDQQVKVEEAKLRIGLEIQKRKDKALKDYQDHRSFIGATEKPEKELFAGFLREIERLAQESGLSILNLTPQNEPQNFKDYKKYKAELRAEGNLENFYQFLENLQNEAMLIKLDKFTLTPKDEAATIIKLESTISLSIPLS